MIGLPRADTDGPKIAGLYALLERRLPSPVVSFNRRVALAMAGAKEAGLAIIDELSGDPRLTVISCGGDPGRAPATPGRQECGGAPSIQRKSQSRPRP
jgi:hypothetical protein